MIKPKVLILLGLYFQRSDTLTFYISLAALGIYRQQFSAVGTAQPLSNTKYAERKRITN